jgi:hypothetical protein
LVIEDEESVVEVEVSLEKDSEDLGSFTLVPKGTANFKILFESKTEIFYGDEKLYTGDIVVENIGYGIGSGLNFDVSLDGAKTFNENTVLGSIPIGSTKKIPVEFSFNPQLENVVDYTLSVDITDANGNIWREETYIPVHKGLFRTILSAEQDIQGVLKYPDGKRVEINEANKVLDLPLIKSNQFYTLIFTNYGNLNGEMIYGVGIESQVSNFTGFKDTTAFESNDELENAHTLNLGDSVLSYLHYNDIDYFKIATDENSEYFDFSSINQIPVARISNLNDIGIYEKEITLDGSNSSDDNGITSYQWESSLDGSLGNSETLQISTLSEGVHTILLTVTDSDGMKGSTSKTIEIVKNEEPIAKIESLRDHYYLTESILLDGSGTSDADGDSLTYKWESNLDGLLGSSKTLTTTLSEGTHTITLTVTDPKSGISSASITFEVSGTMPETYVWSGENFETYDVSLKTVTSFDEALAIEIQQGEFETSAQFEARKKEEGSDVLNSWLGDQGISMAYNADSEKFTVTANYGVEFEIDVAPEDAEGFKANVDTFDIVFTRDDGVLFVSRAEKTYRGKTYISEFEYYGVEEKYKEQRERAINSVTTTVGGVMFEDYRRFRLELVTFEDAYSNCYNLELAGFSDWRLPSINELQIAYNYASSFSYNPKTDVSWADSYWSSSMPIDDNTLVYVGIFNNGSTFNTTERKHNTDYLDEMYMCVRSTE